MAPQSAYHRAFRPERLGFGKADSARPTGDNGHTAFDAQIHEMTCGEVVPAGELYPTIKAFIDAGRP